MAQLAHTRNTVVQATATVMPVLLGISLVHFLNDSMQAAVSAMFPILQKSLFLTYTQVGLILFMLNMTSSVIQPFVGYFTDRRPSPYMLPLGMVMSLIGIVGLALSPNFPLLLLSVMFIGFGSAAFHPEGARVVYLAAGERRGLAQSIYQVGGNLGSSMAPLMLIFIFSPLGQIGALWATALAGVAILVLLALVPWYKRSLAAWEAMRAAKRAKKASAGAPLLAQDASHPRAIFAMVLIIFLIFARSWYHSSIVSFYQFHMRDHYGIPIEQAQIPLFLFLITGVIGTLMGGFLADRFGLKRTIVFSLTGSAPFALMLPYLPLVWVYPVITLLGLIIMSGFSIMVVYAQQLMPAKVGMASGLTTGFAFGMGAIGAVALGKFADLFGLDVVMLGCSFLPLMGFLAFLLPSDRKPEFYESR
jgi:FSR family fosmidomycin resistance protein-like MFS transporter